VPAELRAPAKLAACVVQTSFCVVPVAGSTSRTSGGAWSTIRTPGTIVSAHVLLFTTASSKAPAPAMNPTGITGGKARARDERDVLDRRERPITRAQTDLWCRDEAGARDRQGRATVLPCELLRDDRRDGHWITTARTAVQSAIPRAAGTG
jgi:hypothetical protein